MFADDESISQVDATLGTALNAFSPREGCYYHPLGLRGAVTTDVQRIGALRSTPYSRHF